MLSVVIIRFVSLLDVIPEFLQLPPHHSEQNTFSSYSCVAKAGWGAKVQWANASGDVISERSANDTSPPPSVYVTYSIQNISTVFRANNINYIGDPINSVYPVHNATLHYNATSYQDQNKSFLCVIDGVNEEFLKQYNSTDDLGYTMTIYANITSIPPELISAGSSKSTGEYVVGIIIGAILILAAILFVILLYYGHRQRSRKRKLSIQAPFTKLTVEVAVDLKSVDDSDKAQFPREKVALLEVLGKFYLLLLLLSIVNVTSTGEGNFGVVWKAKAEGIVQDAPHLNIVAVKTIKGTYACHCYTHEFIACIIIILDPLNLNAVNDLQSELIILLKMTPHFNICNLLGYCNGEG